MRIRAALAWVVLVIAGPLQPAVAQSAFPDDTLAVGLSQTEDPNIEVALELSRATFDDGGSEVVLIGRNNVFADSLSAGAAQADGPLLLVATDPPIADAVVAEVQRLGASRAIILGGEAAVSVGVADQLAGLGLDVTRLSGDNRVTTALAVAAAVAPQADTAILARAGGVEGDGASAFADALSAGGWAAATRWPVLLTQTENLPSATRDYLELSAVRTVKVMGGTAAVSHGVVEELLALGLTVDRVAGPDRAATAVGVAAARGFTSAADADQVIVVDGYGDEAWAAGFAAAARSARLEAPIVLGNLDSLPPATTDWLAPGPDQLTCALNLEVCEEARLAVGFEQGLNAEVPPGTLTFIARNAVESGVYAASADGTHLGLAHQCTTRGCVDLDWAAGGRSMALMELGEGVHELSGLRLALHDSFFTGGRITLRQMAAGEDAEFPHLGAAYDVRGDRPRVVTAAMVGARGADNQGAQSDARLTLPSRQVFNRHPAYLPTVGAMLFANSSSDLRIKGAIDEETSETVMAHVQRRAGATLVGAAWAPDGSGDIAIVDEIGGQGLLRVAPYPQGPVVTVEDLDVTGIPVWTGDSSAVLVMARIDDGIAVVRVDAADGRIEVLLDDTGAAPDARLEADPSTSFVAWPRDGDIQVLDTRDGSVVVVDMPQGMQFAGAFAFRP